MTKGDSHDLAETSHRLSLLVDPPGHGRWFHPGDPITGRACVLSDLSSYTTLELSLRVYSRVKIMGKDRWQYGQAFTGGAGIVPPVASVEEHEIYADTRLLWPAPDDALMNKKGGHRTSSSIDLPFELALPSHQPMCACGGEHPHPLPMPSTVHPEDIATDFSDINVCYMLKVKGKRKGMLKTDDTLKLEIPVAAYIAELPTYTDLPLLERTESRRPLLFKGTAGSLMLEARLELGATIVTAPSELTWTISWWLVSAAGGGEPPPDSVLASIAPSIEISLVRFPFTKPIDKPSSGQPFYWANSRISQGKVITGPYDSKGGQREASGTLSIPAHCVSFRSCGAGMSFRVSAILGSKDHLDGYLKLGQVVTISHSDV